MVEKPVQREDQREIHKVKKILKIMVKDQSAKVKSLPILKMTLIILKTMRNHLQDLVTTTLMLHQTMMTVKVQLTLVNNLMTIQKIQRDQDQLTKMTLNHLTMMTANIHMTILNQEIQKNQ